MSSHIVINSWSGTNKDLAIARLSKLFRMEPGKTAPIFSNLESGQTWRFDRRVNDQQGNRAITFLRQLGFDAELAAPESLPKPKAAPPAKKAEPDRTAYVEEATEAEPEEALRPVSQGASFLGFHGKAGELFSIYIVNLFLTILTLGIYRFWAKTKVRHYIWAHFSVLGDRLSYHGTAKELFIGFLKFFGLMAVVVGGLTGLMAVSPPNLAELINILITLFIVLLIPVLMVGAMKYRLSRTSLRGIRFSFRGKRKQALGLFIKGFFLNVLTLGFYKPYYDMHMQKFWRENSFFGNKHFTFTGKGKEIFGKYMALVFLIIPTLGLYLCWYTASIKQYTWSHTRFMGGKFRFTATGGHYFKLWHGNFWILLLSLGLGMPWIIVRNNKFMADHLHLDGVTNFNKIVQDIKDAGALGDEAADVFDVPLDVM